MNTAAKTRMLLITGPTGVGKSTIADAVFEYLRLASRPIALINFDELTYASPLEDDPYGTQLGLLNLKSMWKNYSDRGITHVVIPYVIESKSDIARFQTAIPAVAITTILLSANYDTLKHRLSERPMGGSLQWHLERAKELQLLFENTHVADATIPTDNKTVSEITKQIIEAWDSATL